MRSAATSSMCRPRKSLNNASNSAGAAVITATNSNVGALTASDYRLSFNAGTWTLTRLTDSTASTFAAFPQTIDGITFASPSGVAANGDSYLIQPTRQAARDISVAVTDTARIAAAAPIRTASTLANTGSATIAAGTVNTPPPPNANLQQPVTITFTSATTFNVTGTGTGNPVGVAYTTGANITYNGWTTQINGTPAAGDTFTIAAEHGRHRGQSQCAAARWTADAQHGGERNRQLPERVRPDGE